MHEKPHIAEVEPACRLVHDHPPPIASVWLISKYGAGCRGVYYPEGGFVAWAPLPKMTPEQKQRLAEIEAQGLDPTRPAGKQVKAAEPVESGFLEDIHGPIATNP